MKLTDYQSQYGKTNYPWDKEPQKEEPITPVDLNKTPQQVLEEVWEEMGLSEDTRQEIRDSLPFMF